MLQSLREETEGKLRMLSSPEKNSLTSLFEEVRVFKEGARGPGSRGGPGSWLEPGPLASPDGGVRFESHRTSRWHGAIQATKRPILPASITCMADVFQRHENGISARQKKLTKKKTNAELFGVCARNPLFTKPAGHLKLTICPETMKERICFRILRCKSYVTASEMNSPGGPIRQKSQFTRYYGTEKHSSSCKNYHPSGNKYISNSRGFFDVRVFALNSNSLARNIFHICVFASVTR